MEKHEGIIYLEDGSVFKGKAFGFTGTAVGELVFNTSMTGYQEILTDPSYKGQIINLTYPLIGNYGISDIDNESPKIHAFGLVIKDLCENPSNSNCVKTLDQWLREQKVPGVYDVDSRQITKLVRKHGTVKCLISTEGISIKKAKVLCEAGSLRGDWMKEVATIDKYVIEPDKGFKEKPLNVAVLDFGVKGNILNCLKARNCRLTVYPYGTSAEEILAGRPDGVFLTNGPGDPEEAVEAIEEVRKLIDLKNLPMFGICMGHQVLALAFGGKTYKLKYGHRGANHGVYDKDTKRSYITSQNHGYAVKYESVILRGMEITHLNLNDGTVEGMEHRDLPIFSVQFHPEASAGPNDTAYLFDKFVKMMKEDQDA
ncbi:MAG: glutamine-hydrolyzing carbamoyl-phosphate synthase small subunit [Lachnospiraceae bacterium]|nr:glutamine-hydrolyzing carbamoyl-phosphate synthase small subunit [Lachnospiraceae bacterium]